MISHQFDLASIPNEGAQNNKVMGVKNRSRGDTYDPFSVHHMFQKFRNSLRSENNSRFNREKLGRMTTRGWDSQQIMQQNVRVPDEEILINRLQLVGPE